MRNEPYLIDRITAIELFDKMIARSVSWRVLRLTGSGKMGKSRLMREYRHRSRTHTAVVELGEAFPDPVSVLAALRNQLRAFPFGHFVAAHDEYAQRPVVDIQDAKAFMSKMTVDVREHADAADYRQRQLTECFLRDLAEIGPANPIVLCFDSFEQASPAQQTWLQQHLLGALCQLDHVCTVVAGRQLPQVPLAWDVHCYDHELEPVTLSDYIEFARKMGLALAESDLRTLHIAFDGRPGLFADSAPKFMQDVA
ncbi:MAG: ATP-binding protein [Anaerolineae bacterium]|nr:ATP-binding protein [Anaerolineae bacterium]